MKRAAAAPKIPREIKLPCRDCQGGFVTEINGAYMRGEREAAHVTVDQAARACGVSRQHMSRMERGERPFERGYADICERFFTLRRRSGPE